MRPGLLNELEQMLDEGHEHFFCDATLLSTIGELKLVAAGERLQGCSANDRRIGMALRILRNEAARRNDARSTQDEDAI